jgi:hypothetical protein
LPLSVRSIVNPPDERLAVRRRDVAPLVTDLVKWMRSERSKLSRNNEVAKAFDYMACELFPSIDNSHIRTSRLTISRETRTFFGHNKCMTCGRFQAVTAM